VLTRRQFVKAAGVLIPSAKLWIPPARAHHGRGSPGAFLVKSYNAITNQTEYQEGTAPSWGAAGSTFTDPVFGTEMLRVTDANTNSAKTNHPYVSCTGSTEECRWNSDSSMFCVMGDGSETYVFSFNKSAFSASIVSIPGNSNNTVPGSFSGDDMEWDFSNNQLLYGCNGDGVSSINVSSGTVTQVWNLSSESGYGNPANLMLSRSGRMCVRLGPQDTATAVAVYDPSGPTQWVLDVNAGTINGVSIPSWTSFTIHNVRFDPNGRFVKITNTGGTGITNAYAYIWDVLNGTVTASINTSGHSCIADGRVVYNGQASGQTYSVYDWAIMAATNPGETNATALAGPPSGSPNGTDAYQNWSNSVSTYDMPVLVTCFFDSGTDPGTITGPWDREVLAIDTTGAGTVWRLFHHYNRWNNGAADAFYCGCFASLDRTGAYAIFTSNMVNGLGTSTISTYRTDVFIAKLPAVYG
jgi:hypothetical protein